MELNKGISDVQYKMASESAMSMALEHAIDFWKKWQADTGIEKAVKDPQTIEAARQIFENGFHAGALCALLHIVNNPLPTFNAVLEAQGKINTKN